MNKRDAVLGQEVVVPRYGVGRITSISDGSSFPYLAIGVTPYVAKYEMHFDPKNVTPWPIAANDPKIPASEDPPSLR